MSIQRSPNASVMVAITVVGTVIVMICSWVLANLAVAARDIFKFLGTI
jgi:hypothetical protein